MHKTLDVITIGEAMAMFVATETGELSAVERFIKRVAGAELNVATGLARLGLNVGWVSRVGDDSFGHFVLDSLKKRGLMPKASRSTGASRPAFSLSLKSKMEPIPSWNTSAKGRRQAISRWKIITPTILHAHAICT